MSAFMQWLRSLASPVSYRLDLRGRLMVLAMMPVIVFAVTWGTYIVHQRDADLRAQLQQRAQLLARQMATAADYGIFSGNTAALQTLTLAVSREASVVLATIYSANREMLARHLADGYPANDKDQHIQALFQKSLRMGQQSTNIGQGNWIAYLEPVRSPMLVVDDIPEPGNGSTEARTRGYAIVEVSLDSVRGEMLRFGLTVSSLLAGVLASVGFIAHRFSQRLDRRIREVAQAAQSIGAGATGVRLGPVNIAIFDRLANDLNGMAEQLEQSRQGLELRIENATAALREQRDTAERASSAKTRFLAAASHDLRQPMHALSLLVAALKQEQTAALRDELLKRIDATSEAMSGLLDALLDISRLDAGGVRAKTEVFALQFLLMRLQDTYEAFASRKSIDLQVISSPLWVRSDPMLLERILGNFLSNAIRYTPPGGRVLVCARNRGDTCLVQVRDNGPGIEEVHQQAIFQEFVQIHNPQRDRSQGLGLGLAIVQRLAQLLDHPIGLRSEPGRGSTFEVSVSVHLTQAGEGEPLASEVEVPANAHPLDPNGLHSCRIILVEDDALVRDSYQRLLQLWGCDVRIYADGESALAQALADPWTPQIIITDHRLGSGVNGLQLIAQIRSQKGTQIPAVLITGDTEEPALRSAGDALTRVLFKPVRPAVLHQVLIRFNNPVADHSGAV